MADTLIAPEYELFPNRYRWTVQECYQMAARGQLLGRYEILDGEVVSKVGQNPAHAAAIKRLMRAMAALYRLDLLWVQSPITVAAPDNVYTEPESDIAVTHGPPEVYAGRHPGPDDVSIIIEVSDTTLRTDLIVKTRLYARAGIPEYWIVDLPGRQIHVHRAPDNGNYSRVSVHGEADTVAVLAYSEAPIVVSDLLPPAAEGRTGMPAD